MMRRDNPTVIDLFSGCGGLSLGFKQQGFHTLFANDIDASCEETFKANFPEVNFLRGDITRIDLSKINSLIGSARVDVIIGGPPCQGFSIANRQRIIDDPRNKLYKYFVNIVAAKKPLFFVMENVKGILPYKQQILDDFQKIGYFTEAQIVRAKDFGIPQNRERVIFIGAFIKNKADVEKIFKQIASRKVNHAVSLQSALWGLRKVKALRQKHSTHTESPTTGFTEDRLVLKSTPPEYIQLINRGITDDVVYNHKSRYNNDRDIEIFRLMPQGAKSDHASIKHIMPYASRSHIFKDKYFKLIASEPCKTITAHMKFDCNMYIHPFEARGLTPREAARVQSFPDNFIFKGPFTKWYMQIGNAVPPLLANIVAESIKIQLKRGV